MVDEASGQVAARTTLKAVHLDTMRRKSAPLHASVVAKAQALIGAATTA
jgi:hypothetical protein